MTWDQVCTDFATLSLNWDPALNPSTVSRHWTWPKPPSDSQEDSGNIDTSPRYRLCIRGERPQEICVLLSQHTTSKDRPLDDIALHVFEEQHAGGSSKGRVLHPHRVESSVRLPPRIVPCSPLLLGKKLKVQSPYSNGLHVLARYTPRQANADIIVIPSRDRGLFQRDFTIQALASAGVELSLERIKASLPFASVQKGQLSTRNSGGQPGNPSHMINPQYKITISDPQTQTQQSRKPAGAGAGAGRHVRMSIHGDREVPWNVKLVWGSGTRIFE